MIMVNKRYTYAKVDPSVVRKMDKLQMCVTAICSTPTNERLRYLKSTLNDTFKGTRCKEIIYTNNTDKSFFGMCVMPDLSKCDLPKMFIDGDIDVKNKEYSLEFDSKLFEIGLTDREITAILLHEVGHVVVNMERSLEEIIDASNLYMTKTKTNIDVNKMYTSKNIIRFGVENALRKVGDIMENEENKADTVAVSLGYGEELASALDKISLKIVDPNRNVPQNKLIALQWALRVYRDIKIDRASSIRRLNKVLGTNGSRIENGRILMCKEELTKLDSKLSKDCMFYLNIEESVIMEKHNLSIFRNFRKHSMRGVEDDLYEFRLRIKSLDDQYEALEVIRAINARLAIIDDYIRDVETDAEKEKWMGVKKQYLDLREELSNKTTYDDKYYGLFVKTPVVRSRYQQY